MISRTVWTKIIQLVLYLLNLGQNICVYSLQTDLKLYTE